MESARVTRTIVRLLFGVLGFAYAVVNLFFDQPRDIPAYVVLMMLVVLDVLSEISTRATERQAPAD